MKTVDLLLHRSALPRKTMECCNECQRLQDALIDALSRYAAFLQEQNGYYKKGDLISASGSVAGSIFSVGSRVTEAKEALEDHRASGHLAAVSPSEKETIILAWPCPWPEY